MSCSDGDVLERDRHGVGFAVGGARLGAEAGGEPDRPGALAGKSERGRDWFGHVVRGEADSKSDINLLVDLEPGRSLFDLGGLLMNLQDLLGQSES